MLFKKKTMPRTVDWRQLCAIATAEIRREPSMDDSTWVECIKRRLVALHLGYPRPHVMTEAIRAVERVLTKQWRPRR
jgi:hypothetical protein